MAEAKTNAQRIVEKANIPIKTYTYDADSFADGVTVAEKIGKDPLEVFKTIVTKGSKGGYYVFVVPSPSTIDFKRAAKSVGEKSVELVKLDDLLKLTGYIRGGCSPVGMKKLFPTVIDESALLYDTITCSAGRRGLQMELDPNALAALVGAKFEDIAVLEE